jgi:hypothetical protein
LFEGVARRPWMAGGLRPDDVAEVDRLEPVARLELAESRVTVAAACHVAGAWLRGSASPPVDGSFHRGR